MLKGLSKGDYFSDRKEIQSDHEQKVDFLRIKAEMMFTRIPYLTLSVVIIIIVVVVVSIAVTEVSFLI